MEKITINIDQIKDNPNLDISERIRRYLSQGKWTQEEIEEIAIASIKQEYEYWANNRTNISPRTDNMLLSILNGHILNKIEVFEMICDDPTKVEAYAKFERLKGRTSDNAGITLEDLNELCSIIGFDEQMSDAIRTGFADKGLIIDRYNESIHK